MNAVQIFCFFLLCAFYISYLAKMLMLRSRGITGNLLGKGDKPKKAKYIELCLRAATLAGAVMQFGSVIFPSSIWSLTAGTHVKIMGIIFALAGNLFFIEAIVTMKNNWRAGFDRRQNTALVTNGIYGISRNPAFVGFDLIYIGCALAFPNLIHIAVALIAVILFHVQILGEERYLAEAFGQEYARYKATVRRYF